ncbi:MAG: ABC transporter permease [Kordiimonas sp.]
MRKILNVFKKERMDFTRDRRTVFSSLAFALFGPLVMVLALNYGAEKAADKSPMQLAVVGQEYAPNLVRYLSGEGVLVHTRNDEGTLESQIGDAHVLLVIPPEFTEKFSEAMPATLRMFVDRTNQTNSSRSYELTELIRQYSMQVQDMRLLANGIPSLLITPIALQTGNIGTAGGMEKQFATMMLYFFLFAPFFSSLGAAIDTTAGERERKSLQPLLAQPVSTRELILGKWMVAVLFGVVGTTISVVGGVYAFEAAPLDVLGIKLNLDVLTMLGNLLPYALLVAALQVLVALNAKSYKEANTQLQILTFVPAMVGMFFMISDKTPEGLFALIPIVGQLHVMQESALGGAVSLLAIILNGLVAVVIAMLCVEVAARKLGSEQMLKAA